MNDGLIPNRYAKALYKAAAEKHEDALVYNQMRQLDAAYAATPQLRKAVGNPYLPAEQKQQLLRTAAGAAAAGVADKFMGLVINKNRVDFMRAIALAYVKLYRQRNSIASVEVVTATQLPKASLEAIVAAVQRQLQGMTMELATRVDPALIGGFVVNVDSMVLDASVKKQLEKLRLKLLS